MTLPGGRSCRRTGRSAWPSVAETRAAFGLGREDLLARRGSRLSDEAFEAWLTDRVAGRPSGPTAARPREAPDDVLRLASHGPLVGADAPSGHCRPPARC